MEVPAQYIYLGDGSTRIFPIASVIISDEYLKIFLDEVPYLDTTGFDIINNSIVFKTAPAIGVVIVVWVAQSVEAIANLGVTTNVDLVATNIDNVNIVGNDIASVQTVATNIESVKSVGLIAPELDSIITNLTEILETDLRAWEAEASRRTSQSYAIEPEDVFVKVTTSNGDGTYTTTPTTSFSSLHHQIKGLLQDASTKVPLDGSASMTGSLEAPGFTIDGKYVVSSVTNRAELLTKSGIFDGETILQKDIELHYTWSTIQGVDNGGTILNVATGSWVARYDGEIEAIWFGATFDGVTDDSVALSKMREAHPNEIHRMPRGSYIEDSLLKINAEPVIVTPLGKGVDKSPFYLVWSGQSNSAGSANVPVGFLGTSNEVEDGVYVWSNSTDSWIKPVWGTNPLSSSGSNNAGIRCANEIKVRTGRDVYMILSAIGGISIEEWIGLGTSSNMWSVDARSVLDQITKSGLPRIDLVGWMQGEADHDTAGGNYNTYNLYRNALEDLISQFKDLTQWATHTKFITSGIGEWWQLLTFTRNDVLLTLNNWTDKAVGNISTHGSVMNPVVGNTSHFDHDSLTLVGDRIATKYLAGNVGDAPGHTSIREMQGAPLPFYGVTVDQIVTIDPQYLKGGMYTQCANSTFTLPDAWRFDGATLIFNVTTMNTGQPCIINIAPTSSIVYEGVTQASVECNSKGQWVFKSMNGVLYLLEKPDVLSSYSDYTVDTATRLLNLVETNNTVWRVDTATLNLPDPSLLTNTCISIISSANATSTINVPSTTSKFYNNLGVLVDNLTLTGAGDMVRLRAMNTRWAVESQNF